MIIVSQDRKMIVNFRNVENIKIRELSANESGYAVSVETFTSDFDRFAIYDTEERAKEVLAEITEFWKDGAMTDCRGFICYEMPED